MSVAKSFNRITQNTYRKLRAAGKQYYLRKTAKENLRGFKIDSVYKKEILEFYSPYVKVDPVFHAVYYEFTGIRDVRFIPDDVWANYIDRYFNISAKAVVLENKCYFEKMFHGVKQPISIAKRMNWLWFLDDVLVDYEQIKKHVEGLSIVIKQACGSGGGHDVFFLDGTEDADRFDQIIKKINNDIIIQVPLKQHAVLSEVNGSSVNTIRVLSLLTEEGVKIYSCFFRCGRGNSRVDNASMGGLIVGVDKDTGYLKEVAFSLKDYREHYTQHPDSGTVFGNVKVPSWEKIVSLVKAAAPQIPHSRMVAWDITVDEYEEPVLIEANLNDSLVSAHQLVNGPIFKDDTEKILKEVFDHK